MSLVNVKRFVVYNSLKDKELVIDNLALFCRLNDLNENCMRDVIKGRQTQHKGFYAKEYESEKDLKHLYQTHMAPKVPKVFIWSKENMNTNYVADLAMIGASATADVNQLKKGK